MAAGDKITVTKNTLSAFNAATSISAALTANAATADTDGLKQPYAIAPTKAESKGLLIVRSTGAAADGNLTVKLIKGVNGMAAVADLSLTVTKNTTAVIPVDGRFKSATGTFEIEITPAGTDTCLTDHALSVAFVELV